MPRTDVVVECRVPDSFRVQQVAGMFDVPLGAKCTQRFAVDLPGRDEPWDVGLIVGPSGSGKSSVARQAFADCLYGAAEWPVDRAVVDAFGPTPLRQIVALLTAVGFGSPPSWVKPYRVLSCGEQFRCDLARALSVAWNAGGATADNAADDGPPPAALQRPLVAFDEFTSVVDRRVARACSMAIAKGVRSGAIPVRFVAVTCHYDVAEWLEADWVLDMAGAQLHRRRLRRPGIEVEIRRCTHRAWPLFARHHYLSGSLAPGARCYLATWDGEPVTFCATLPLVARRRHRRFTRIVTLPDYQGMGVGMRGVAAVAPLHRAAGLRASATSTPPAPIRHCRRGRPWRPPRVRKAGAQSRSRGRFAAYRAAAGRSVASFEYVGP